MSSTMELLFSSLPAMLKSTVMTIQITGIGLTVGLIGGVCLGICNSKKLKIPFLAKGIDGLVWIIRGTPLFVQVLIAYYALPEWLGFHLSAFAAGILALGVNSTAYISEIIRAGINALPDGQWDAAYVLGYNKQQTLTGIIMPQVFRNTLPALTNELTSLIKETSILAVIGVVELTKISKDIVARELDPMTIYLATAFIYLMLTTIITYLATYLQPKAAL